MRSMIATGRYISSKNSASRYLAPGIIQAIIDGRRPCNLTLDKLLAHSRLPLAWHDQRAVLGFT
jgi:hypothetical protein